MITPDKMESYNQNKIVDMYEDLNRELTKEIIQRIKEIGYVSGYTSNQIRAIIRTGGKEIFKQALMKTNKLTKARKEEVNEIYNDLVQEQLKGYEEQYSRVGAEYKVSKEMLNLLSYISKSTNKSFSNMTKSVAFASKTAFVNEMDKLYKQVTSGQKDYVSAMKESVNRLAKNGITLESNGRHWSLESMARLNLMTSLTQTANSLAKEIGNTIDYNCVVIGHSYRCRPTHNVIDDVVMSKEEFKKYEHLTEEYNCYHIVNYDWREEFENQPNKKTYGKEHQSLKKTTENYRIQQKARYYERQIRNKKNEIASGNTSSAAKVSLRNAKIKYKAFCSANNIRMSDIRTWQSIYNNKNYINGLSGTSYSTSTSHKLPELLKTIDNVSYQNAIKELENYEKIIKDDKIENAIVITRQGEVYRCYGNKFSVYPDIDLNEKLKGAYVTHNHPDIDGIIETFTQQDRNLFYNNELKVLRGISKNYTFEINTNVHFKEKVPTFKEIQMYNNDMYHIENIKYSYKYNCGYKRWKNDK